MSINQLNSLVYQSKQPVAEKVKQRTVHQWNVNDSTVYLLRKQNTLGEDLLGCKLVNKDKKEIYLENFKIRENEDIEKTISFLKTCKVLIDKNGAINFFRNYSTWENSNRGCSWEELIFEKYAKKYENNAIGAENFFKNYCARATKEAVILREHVERKFSPENIFIRSFADYRRWEYAPNTEISLVRISEGLAWNVFQRFSKQSSFYSFQEKTVSSERCHPETVALIEKIKTGAFSNPQLLLCLIMDFEVRILDSNLLYKIFPAELIKIQDDDGLYISDEASSIFKKLKNPARAASLYLLRNVVIAATYSVRDYFSGGVLGALAGASAGVSAGAAVMGVGIAGAVLSTNFIASYFYKSPKDIQNRKETMQKKLESLLEDSLLIEIEPISAPSAIDERVRVSKFTWAITLVTHEGISGNHAQIIIEGINDGFYDENSARIGTAKQVKVGEKFMHFADFSPRINYGLFSPDKLQYETRTEIWMKPSDQVKKMLRSIEEEKYLPKDKFRPFNLWGIRSKLYRINFTQEKDKPVSLSFSEQPGDNCFTFLREKLKIIDIDLGESYVDLIASIVKNYTRNKEDYETLPVQVLI